MICDVAHAHNDTTQGTMISVVSDMTQYTTFVSKAETPIAFCHIFQANVDTVNAHGRYAGCHPKLLDEHAKCLMSERGLDNNSDTDELKKMVDGTRV
eukprot:7611815-Ditylum_brightwellii.AAC.1